MHLSIYRGTPYSFQIFLKVAEIVKVMMFWGLRRHLRPRRPPKAPLTLASPTAPETTDSVNRRKSLFFQKSGSRDWWEVCTSRVPGLYGSCPGFEQVVSQAGTGRVPGFQVFIWRTTAPPRRASSPNSSIACRTCDHTFCSSQAKGPF